MAKAGATTAAVAAATVTVAAVARAAAVVAHLTMMPVVVAVALVPLGREHLQLLQVVHMP